MWRWGGIVALVWVGCGDDDDTPARLVDAGPDAADAADEPFVPAPPAPPQLSPCPSGWSEGTDEDGVAVCAPWQGDLPSTCPPDEVHAPGTPGCAVVGTACGDGPWADDLPDGPDLLYVEPFAPQEGADGTRAHPHPTIARALRAAHDGDVVALARGTYDEAVSLVRAVTLWGACPGETVLAPARAGADAVVQVFAAGGGLRNLRIAAERPAVQIAATAEDVLLEDLVIEDAVGWGVESTGGFSATSIVVRGTRAGPSDLGAGIAVDDGVAVLDRVVVIGSDGWGVIAAEGTSLAAADLAVQGTRGAPWSGRGFGVSVLAGADVHLERAAMVSNEGPGLWAQGDGASLDVVDAVVTGSGVQVLDGATAGLARLRVERPAQTGLLAVAADVTLEDAVIRGAVPVLVLGDLADGAIFGNGAVAHVDRLLLSGNERLGLLAAGPGTEVEAADLRVAHTRSLSDRGDTGHGVEVSARARVVLTRAGLEDNHGIGLFAYGNGTTVEASDVSIVGTGPRLCGAACPGAEGGIGAASVGSSVVLERFALRANELAGAQVGPFGQLELHDGEVRGNPIGVNVQNEQLDLAQLQDDVSYVDNGRNLDSRLLPIPGAGHEPSPEPTPPDVAPGVELRRVGAPRWDFADAHLFVAPLGLSPDDGVEEETLARILDPEAHPFVDELAPRPGVAHPGPWDHELADGVAAAGFAEHTRLDREEFELPNAVWLGGMLLPAEGAPTGRSSDLADGPMIADEDLPIRGAQLVFRDGDVFDPTGFLELAPVGSLEGGDAYEGWSHAPLLYWENEINAPADLADLAGDYVVVLSLRDATGAGWDILARYEIR